MEDFEWSDCHYRDLRSGAVDRRRQRKQKVNYYGHRSSRPEWVGKEYYDIVVAVPVSKPTGSIEDDDGQPKELIRKVENASLLRKLLDSQWLLLTCDRQSLVTTAAAQVMTRYRMLKLPPPSADTIVYSPLLEGLFEGYDSYMEQYIEKPEWHKFRRENPDASLYLKIRTWTKQDGWNGRIHFDEYYDIGRRHHSRRFSFDWRFHNKFKIRASGRDTKSKSRQSDLHEFPINRTTNFDYMLVLESLSAEWSATGCEDAICQKDTGRKPEPLKAHSRGELSSPEDHLRKTTDGSASHDRLDTQATTGGLVLRSQDSVERSMLLESSCESQIVGPSLADILALTQLPTLTTAVSGSQPSCRWSDCGSATLSTSGYDNLSDLEEMLSDVEWVEV